MHFFQFGALSVNLEDLRKLSKKTHIAPEDMAKLKNKIEKLSFVLPAKGMWAKGIGSRQETVRLWMYNFFDKETLGEATSLLETLKWFVFRRYKKEKTEEDLIWRLPINLLTPMVRVFN